MRLFIKRRRRKGPPAPTTIDFEGSQRREGRSKSRSRPGNFLFPQNWGLGGLFCLIALFALPQSTQAQYLHRSHTALVNGAGHPILLRGVNLGNWLYNEPWMIGNTHFDMFADEDGKPDEFQVAIRDLVGADRAAAFYRAWRDHAVTQADIQKIAGLGFNSVRVPLDDRLFYDRATGQNLDTGFVYLDRLLAWCAAWKIYVVPDMHSVPGGKLGWVKGSLYDSPEKQAILAHVWGRIAARYHDNPWIGGYDLVNEPAVWNAPKLSGLYQTLIAAIRQSDTHHLLIVEGDVWGSDLNKLGLTGPGDVWDTNMALSDHDYGARQTPDSLGDHKRLAAGLDLPLWMGEFGYNSNTWDRKQTLLCEAPTPIPQGWCFWAWKSSFWTLTSYDIPGGYKALQDYWNKRKSDPNTPKPDPDVAFAALMTLAQGTTFAHCTVRRDVADALTRPDFLTRAVPYQPGISIPGTITATNYDMGAEGTAYHDTVSSDEAGKGPAGQAWNSGWNYRNDGVDIYPRPDGATPFVVGEIAPGEWLRYSVTVTPGTYDLRIRHSGPGGALHVSLDGADLAGPITLPPTTGWDDYQTQIAANLKITANGPAVLRLDFETGGFNLSRIAFTKPVDNAP